MNGGLSSIHVINADVESVRNRLSFCQFNSQKIVGLEAFRKEIACCSNEITRVNKLVKLLKKQKETKVEFVIVKGSRCVSVFSDFLTYENVTEISKEYFEDLNNLVVAFSLSDSNDFRLDVVKMGTILISLHQSLNADINHQLLDEIRKTIQSPYTEMEWETKPNSINNLELFLGLPLTMTRGTIDANRATVYVDEYVL